MARDTLLNSKEIIDFANRIEYITKILEVIQQKLNMMILYCWKLALLYSSFRGCLLNSRKRLKKNIYLTLGQYLHRKMYLPMNLIPLAKETLCGI